MMIRLGVAALLLFLAEGCSSGNQQAKAEEAKADSPATAASGLMPFDEAMPWITYQAEDMSTNGEVASSRTRGEIPNEAVGRACVRLSSPDQFVEFQSRADANALIVRACVPDAPQGGGAITKLVLSVNGTARQELSLSSKFSWLYGDSANPQSNDPSGFAHAFYDETRAFVTGDPIRPNDVVRLSLANPAEATESNWCVIDLVDLEAVPEPLSMPEGFVSIVDFGATPDDGQDDKAAIQECIEEVAANPELKGVWFPAGVWHQTAVLNVSECTVRGAGMWYTAITAIGKSEEWAGNIGFRLTGKNAHVSDLLIDGTILGRGGKQHGFIGGVDGFSVERVWIEHTNTGVWMGGCSNGVFRYCRFRTTYADGLNLNGGAHDVVVEYTHARGNGDDGLAIFSNKDHKDRVFEPCRNILMRNNRVDAQWWGNGMAMYGGRDNIAENNIIDSAASGVGFILTTGFKSHPMENACVRYNVLSRCGGTSWGNTKGAVFIETTGESISNLDVSQNTITEPTLATVEIAGKKNGSTLGVAIHDNAIQTTKSPVFLITQDASGVVSIYNNSMGGLPDGGEPIQNLAVGTALRLQTTAP